MIYYLSFFHIFPSCQSVTCIVLLCFFKIIISVIHLFYLDLLVKSRRASFCPWLEGMWCSCWYHRSILMCFPLRVYCSERVWSFLWPLWQLKKESEVIKRDGANEPLQTEKRSKHGSPTHCVHWINTLTQTKKAVQEKDFKILIISKNKRAVLDCYFELNLNF